MSFSLRLIFVLTFFLIIDAGFAQKTVKKADVLNSGPVIGYAEKKEAKIWLQTLMEAEVYIEYYSHLSSEKKHRTINHKTKKETGYTTSLLLDEVLPGTKYQYDVFVNKKKVILYEHRNYRFSREHQQTTCHNIGSKRAFSNRYQ